MSLIDLSPRSVIDRLSGAVFILWFFLPVAISPATGTEAASLLSPVSLPMYWASHGLAGAPFFYLAYLIPIYGLFKLVSFFVGGLIGYAGRSDTITADLSRIIATAIAVFCFVIPVLSWGQTPAYYGSIPIVAWLAAIIILALNIYSSSRFLFGLNMKDPVYREYREFRAEVESGADVPGSARLVDVIFRIRTKLIIVFIGIIAVVLIILATILLYNYQGTIIKAVGDGARSQILQAASVYKVNLGDTLAMQEYLQKQVSLNANAEFRFDSLNFYTQRKNTVLLENVAGTTVPDYEAEFSSAAPDTQYPKIDPLPGALAAQYGSLALKGGVLDQSASGSFTDSAKGIFSYVAPFTVPGTIKDGANETKGTRLLGVAVINFKQDEILRPYFTTRSVVFVLTAVLLYLAVVLVYIVGNLIVNPLLFLRMSVRRVSDTLRSMIRGSARISPGSLVFTDRVKSKDEIQSLSGEIGDMVTVIRGIIPYVSASTLKQAEKGESVSTEKELAFLFTDIRGFTTLCEGMKPDEVVAVLNRYLDLETEIILKNSGDVDKFVGDEMMAFFDGPDKEMNACRAAMEIRKAMQEEKEVRDKAGLPTVAIGIGINVGPVVFGSVGARDRMDFTSIGDTVNLAARLEGANKAYGSKSIITHAVYEKVKDHFVCRELDFIAVKGKTEPVRIYEILQEKKHASPKLEEIRTMFEVGLNHYRKRDWKKAEEVFARNVEKYKDGPSEIFLERVSHFSIEPPPAEWDGVFRMKVK